MAQFCHAVASPVALASYRLTFGASFLAALVNAIFGLIVAWVLVRYKFFGKRLVDALVDLPFALPTAVGRITLATIYAPTAGSVNGLRRSESRCPTRGSEFLSRSRSSACRSSCGRCSRCWKTLIPKSRKPPRVLARTAGRFSGASFSDADAGAPHRFRCSRSPVRSANTARSFSSPATSR